LAVYILFSCSVCGCRPSSRRELANEKDLCGGRNELYGRKCICTTARSVHEQGELWLLIPISHLIIRSLRQKSKPLQILGMKRQSSTSRTAFTRVRSHWRTHLEVHSDAARCARSVTCSLRSAKRKLTAHLDETLFRFDVFHIMCSSAHYYIREDASPGADRRRSHGVRQKRDTTIDHRSDD
jgi:hypothetical protein